MSKRSRSRSGVEKKGKLRRRAAKLRKRAWDFVDAFARSGSGVAPPTLFGYGNERAHRWAMINRARWWKRPLRTRGNRRKIDWARLFDTFQGPTFAEAIRRRLLAPVSTFGPDYGLPIADPGFSPKPGDSWDVKMGDGVRARFKLLEPERAELVIDIVAPVRAKDINVTIGFEDLAVSPQPVDLEIGGLEIKGARMIMALEKENGDVKVGITYDEAERKDDPKT